MITIVEKVYFNNQFVCYKITLSNGKILSVPLDETNSDYQAILEWVAEGNTITDNGGGE